MKRHFISLILLVLFFNSCQKNEQPTVTLLEIPAIGQSSESNLHTTANNELLLSWISSDIKRSKLFVSKLNTNNTWTNSKLIAEGTDWFVNWADFPSIASFGDNNLITYYLGKSADDTYAYDIEMQLSNDSGRSWSLPFKAHHDNTNTEHGFVSMDELSDDSFLAIWLDGRNYQYHEKDSTIAKQMTLRSAVINAQKEFINELEIDAKVCDCCQTDLVSKGEEAIAIYRNRSDEEIRDIYYSKYANSSWSEPKAIHNDHWKITGCPVNGPRIDAFNNTVAAVWFTLNDTNIPTIKHVFSTDFGEQFSTPIIISKNTPLGRVDIKLIDEKTSVITWMETVDAKTVIYLQKISVDGSKSEKIELTITSESRSSGFPRLALKGHYAYVTWTEATEPSNIKLAKIDLMQIN